MIEERAAAIRRSGLSPNMGANELDRHCRIAAAAVSSDMVMLSIVETDRQFFPASIGLREPFASLGETPLTHSFCQYVVERDALLHIPDATTEPLVADSLAQTELGIESYIGIPVRDDGGIVLGALCAMAGSPRFWTDGEVAVLIDISHAIESELRLRVSQAAQQRQVEDEQISREYEAALSQFADAANREQTMQGVADELATRVAPAIGATHTSIAIVENRMLRFVAGDGSTSLLWDQPRQTLDASSPMGDAASSGRVVHLARPADFDQYPEFRQVALDSGIRSLRAIPFSDEESGVQGVLSIGWAGRMYVRDVPVLLARIAELAATTLARAWKFEVERNQARLLERVVLPTSLPETGVYGVAGYHIAPEAGQRVGGDIYDVVVRADGAIGVMVADAVGHDVSATRAAARLRHAAGVLILEGYRPGAVMSAVNRYVAMASTDRMVTCVCLVFAADGSSVTIANAGHPQPLHRSGSGVELVGPMGESILGRGDTEYSEVTIDLAPGDVVMSFTDGLVERQGLSFLEGEQWLVDFLGRQPEADPHEINDRLKAEIAQWNINDDLAYLVVTRRETVGRAALTWSGPSSAVVLAEIRDLVAGWLGDLTDTAPSGAENDLLLVVTELMTNARDACRPDEDVELTIRTPQVAGVVGGVVEIVVSNPSPEFDEDLQMPAPTAIRGRGLAIVDLLARTMAIETVDGRTTVRATVPMTDSTSS